MAADSQGTIGHSSDTIEQALNQLRTQSPQSTIQLVKPLSGSKSGAQVFLCDLKAFTSAESSADVLNGQFVLKVQRIQATQESSYEAFLAWYPEFAEKHVPQLVFAQTSGDTRTEIYDVASFSLDTV
jgi:hypothetical protein